MSIPEANNLRYFVFGRCPVEITAATFTILSFAFHGIPQFLQEKSGIS
jgi:hypothetical protein